VKFCVGLAYRDTCTFCVTNYCVLGIVNEIIASINDRTSENFNIISVLAGKLKGRNFKNNNFMKFLQAFEEEEGSLCLSQVFHFTRCSCPSSVGPHDQLPYSVNLMVKKCSSSQRV
jgi:hypothetical protein